jgi:hypothetical protein
MEEETKNDCCHMHKRHKGKNACSPSGAVYGLGMIGAAVYFIQHASTFWMGVLGLLKAIVWPAFLIYQFLGFFNM